MPLERIVHTDAAAIGMALENDSEHVEAFALEPIGGAPVADHAVYPRRCPIDAGFYAQPMAQLERIQMIHNVIARLALEPIDGGQVAQEIELEAGLIAKRAEQIVPALAADSDSFLAASIFRAEDFIAEALFQFFNQHQRTLRTIS